MAPTPKQSDKSGSQRQKEAAETSSTPTASGNSIIQSLAIAIAAFDADLKIIEANCQLRKLVYPADYIDKALAKGTDERVWRGWTEQIRSVLSSGQARTFDEVSYTLEGRTRLLRITCTALQGNNAQEIAGGTILIEDVTEETAVQRQLAEAERLATLGRLAAKVAHELNNPMDGILRYVNLAIRVVEQARPEKAKEYLTQCREGLMRMVQITSELLEFSRRARTSLEYVRIDQIIEDAIKSMELRAEALKVRILRDYCGNMPEIRSGSLFQVFCNLAKNALDAMPNGGELLISSRIEGENAVVEFRDTGTGFAPENAEALFEPFFTTRGPGGGAGLGLAICRDILDGYGGKITAKNAPGGGSIFTVLLPVISNSIE
ncbi:MAG: PAS domain-containing protein [Sedimentisphaerales bacterium]|nr:PAS domain-containing protein [Sedimentisphaerales bacterium]